jgi:hypothetical protein
MTVIQKSLKFIQSMECIFPGTSGDNQALAHLQMRPILSCNMIQHFSSESSCQEIRPDQLRELKEKLVAGRDDEVGDNVMTCWFLLFIDKWSCCRS